MKILVADSLSGNLMSATRVFKSEGYEVVTTQYGTEVIELLRQNPDIKLAIIDLDLEGQMQGPELIRKIEEEFTAVAWLMTGASNHEAVSDFEKFLLKPFTSQDLKEAVMKTLGAQ